VGGSWIVSTQQPHEPLTMSVERAGQLLGISRGLAYDLVRRGEIPAVRLGRRLVVPVRAIDEILSVRPTEPS
jgi:excisionase family DNA binding protein